MGIPKTRRTPAPFPEGNLYMTNIKAIYTEIWKCTFKYEGRTSRIKYWIFTGIIISVVFLVPIILDEIFGYSSDFLDSMTALVLIIHIPPLISASVRRIHDINKSGYYYVLWVLIPIIGLVQSVMPGTQGNNRFGEPDAS